jgi:hypothetical protein
VKVICELLSAETFEVITSHELQSETCDMGAFGPIANNPFPASQLYSTILFENEAYITYKVQPVRSESCIYP